MKRETRTVYYDEELQIEAYRFLGLKREFPNHFHKNYVLGFIEEGKRILSCRNQVREVQPGEIVIFHPKENHTCRQVGEETLDYRSLEISTEVMQKLVLEITGKEYLPGFTQNVICDEILRSLKKKKSCCFCFQGCLKNMRSHFRWICRTAVRRSSGPVPLWTGITVSRYHWMQSAGRPV